MSLAGKTLIIERGCITNVTNKFIEVKDAVIKSEAQKNTKAEYGFEA